MIIGVLKEPSPETRVSLLPEHVTILQKWKVAVMIETDAGIKAFATDENYTSAGATTGNREEIIKAADIILAINQPQIDTSLLRSKVLLGVYQPLFNHSLMEAFAREGVTPGNFVVTSGGAGRTVAVAAAFFSSTIS